MTTLNCESTASIYQSVERAYSIEPVRLNAVFDQVGGKTCYFDSVSDDDLVSALHQVGTTPFPFESTYWFHLTRTNTDNKFEAGILPLGMTIDSVWKMLFELLNGFPEELWREFHIGMEMSFVDDVSGVEDYRRKVHDGFHWGPYAYLIKEHVLRDYRRFRVLTRYLDVPEVVENICLAFEEKYGIDLMALFRANTSPCIVRFRVDGFEHKHLGAALRYIYYQWHGAPDLPFNPIRKGAVAPAQIDDIVFL